MKRGVAIAFLAVYGVFAIALGMLSVYSFRHSKNAGPGAAAAAGAAYSIFRAAKVMRKTKREAGPGGQP